METNRRGALGVLGGGFGMIASKISGAARGVDVPSGLLTSATPHESIGLNRTDVKNTWMWGELQSLLDGGQDADMMNDARHTARSWIDPDIMAMRSLSDGRKYTMQVERNFAHMKEQRRVSLLRQIDDWMKG